MELRHVLRHKPILKNLTQYLAPIDYMSLARALTQLILPYRKTLNEMVGKSLLHHLKMYFDEKISKYILNHLGADYALAGSFLFAAITNDTHFLPQVIHVLHQREKPSVDPTILGRKLQILHVRDKLKEYDFDFLNNYYNSNGLFITSFDSVIYRKCRINLEKTYLVKFIPEGDEILEIEERIQEYRARGYLIDIEPGLSDQDLCAYLKMRHKGKGLADLAKKWNAFWLNKR